MTLRPILKSKKTRTIVLFFLLFLLLPFSYQCVKMPLDPKAPQWPVDLNLQVIDRTFTFGQMIEKDPKFITDSTTSHVEYRPSSIANSPSAIVLPELNPLQAAVGNKLGLLQFDVTSISGINVSASQLFPGSALPLTYPPIAPNLSIGMQQAVSNPGALYDYVVFENGQMTLTIKNNFLFTIKFANPGVQLVNTDMFANPAASDSVVAAFTFAGGIAPGVTATSTASLSGSPGKRMSANLILRFTVQSDDIQGKLISAGDNLTAGMTIDGGAPLTKPTMSSARIQLSTPYDVKNLPDSSIQIVDDSTKIKRAEFRDGKFTVTITNNIPTRIAVDFKLKEFVDKVTGVAFKLRDDVTLIDTIPARNAITGAPGTLLQTVYMTDYAIQSQDTIHTGAKIDTLSVPNVHFSLKIKTLAATANRVVISKDDSVQVAIVPGTNNRGNKTYILDKVIGKVKPTAVPISHTVPSKVGDIDNKFTADSIKFDSVSITLKILMGTQGSGSFPTDLAMKIIGLDKNGVRRDSLIAREVRGGILSDTLRINPGVEKRIVFDKSTSSGGHGIDQFLSSFFSGGSGGLPQQFIVTGRALVDPPSYYQYPESTGTVKAGDSVYTSVEFKFPVRIGIINGTYTDTIPPPDTSGYGKVKKYIGQIDTGKVIFTINNGFPFQLDVNTWLLPALPRALATDTLKADPDTAHVLLWLPKKGSAITADSARYFTAPAPNYDPIGKTASVISLTRDDIDKVVSTSFVAVSIKLKTSGNANPVEFKKDYYVQLKEFVSVRFNVNFDKLK
jgi:hypothetical protein